MKEKEQYFFDNAPNPGSVIFCCPMIHEIKKPPLCGGFLIILFKIHLIIFFKVRCLRQHVSRIAKFAVCFAVTKVNYQANRHPGKSNF